MLWVLLLLGLQAEASLFSRTGLNDLDRTFVSPNLVRLLQTGSVESEKPSKAMTPPLEQQMRASYFSAMKSLADREGIPLMSSNSPSLLGLGDSLRPPRLLFPAKIYRSAGVPSPSQSSATPLCQKLRMC